MAEKWKRIAGFSEYLKINNVNAIPAEVQIFSIGDVALVFLPSEVFVEHGLKIKQASGQVVEEIYKSNID